MRYSNCKAQDYLQCARVCGLIFSRVLQDESSESVDDLRLLTHEPEA